MGLMNSAHRAPCLPVRPLRAVCPIIPEHLTGSQGKGLQLGVQGRARLLLAVRGVKEHW